MLNDTNSQTHKERLSDNHGLNTTDIQPFGGQHNYVIQLHHITYVYVCIPKYVYVCVHADKQKQFTYTTHRQKEVMAVCKLSSAILCKLEVVSI